MITVLRWQSLHLVLKLFGTHAMLRTDKYQKFVRFWKDAKNWRYVIEFHSITIFT